MTLDYKQLAINYFEAWKNKDINKLDNIFSESVKLIDWALNLNGKIDVVSHNKFFFQSVTQIELEVISLIEDKGHVAAELSIKVDANDWLPVVDIINFDTNGQITKIVAYKRT